MYGVHNAVVPPFPPSRPADRGSRIKGALGGRMGGDAWECLFVDVVLSMIPMDGCSCFVVLCCAVPDW